MRLNRVRNEKELQALRREIEIGKEANQQAEEELLRIFESLETPQRLGQAGRRAACRTRGRSGRKERRMPDAHRARCRRRSRPARDPHTHGRNARQQTCGKNMSRSSSDAAVPRWSKCATEPASAVTCICRRSSSTSCNGHAMCGSARTATASCSGARNV